MKRCSDSPATYPRVYRLRRYVDILWTCTGIGGILLGVVTGMWFWDEPNMAPNVRPVFMAGAAYFLLFGVFALVARFRYGFILYHDRIQVSRILTRREMRKEDIADVRRTPTIFSDHITLISKNPGEKNLRIFEGLQTDEFFDRWLTSLPPMRDGPRASS
jgi:hypothetical protein